MSVALTQDKHTIGIHPDIKIVSLSGASGSGKNFMADQLQRWEPRMNLIRSFTTRVLRLNQDHEYKHVDHNEFLELIENEEFLWNTDPEQSHGNLYGTLRCDIDEALAQPWPSLIHVTPHTAHHLREYAPARARVFSIYVEVDEDLRLQRLMERDPSKDQGYYNERIQSCRNWRDFAGSSGRFNLFVNNDNTKRSLTEIMNEIITNLQQPIGLPVAF